jgi:hypothetical protein
MGSFRYQKQFEILAAGGTNTVLTTDPHSSYVIKSTGHVSLGANNWSVTYTGTVAGQTIITNYIANVNSSGTGTVTINGTVIPEYLTCIENGTGAGQTASDLYVVSVYDGAAWTNTILVDRTNDPFVTPFLTTAAVLYTPGVSDIVGPLRSGRFSITSPGIGGISDATYIWQRIGNVVTGNLQLSISDRTALPIVASNLDFTIDVPVRPSSAGISNLHGTGTAQLFASANPNKFYPVFVQNDTGVPTTKIRVLAEDLSTASVTGGTGLGSISIEFSYYI